MAKAAVYSGLLGGPYACPGYPRMRQSEPLELLLRSLVISRLVPTILEYGREMCLSAGMDDYISKPLIIEDLRNAIDGCLAHRAR